MSKDRRDSFRVSETRLITEIVSDRPSAASAVNLSSSGLYTVKPARTGRRGPRLVQLEIPLPEASESIWATGEIVFEAVGRWSMGSGIHFVDMANAHRRLLEDYLEHRRREVLARLLREIRWRKQLAACPSPFVAPPPGMVHEDTVRMYLLPECRV